MVYGRKFGDRNLSFEPSGGLKMASLVMRDRESDSWWSIMTSKGIGGEFEGAELPKLEGGEKSTYGDWRRRHPDTLVLSVGGLEHDASNSYENYFTNERVFQDKTPDDDRLPPKESIYSFHSAAKAFAVTHARIEGGGRFDIGLKDAVLLLYRDPGASVFASTEAYLAESELSLEELLARRGEWTPFADGFDTYWYSWIGQNSGSEILQ